MRHQIGQRGLAAAGTADQRHGLAGIDHQLYAVECRPFEIAMRCWQKGFYVRYGGDTIQLAPPFISEKAELDRLIGVWTAGQDIETVLQQLEAANVPTSKVYTVADIAADPQYRHRRMVTEVKDPSAKKVTAVSLKNLKTGAVSDLPCAGVFVAIGHTPNTGPFKGKLDMDPDGYLLRFAQSLGERPL